MNLRTYLTGTVSYPAMIIGLRFPEIRAVETITVDGGPPQPFKSRRTMPNGDVVFKMADGSTLRAPGPARRRRAA